MIYEKEVFEKLISGKYDGTSYFANNENYTTKLYSSIIHTELGNMLALSNDNELVFLEFVDKVCFKGRLDKFIKTLDAVVVQNKSQVLKQTENELNEYFKGNLKKFNVKTKSFGSDFSTCVWNELKKIDYGTTISYLELAKRINSPTKARAVGRANGINHIPIIIPCHRVITSKGELGGFNGGVHRKEWLLKHEMKFNI